MNPVSSASRSLSHLVRGGQTAGMWHTVVRPLGANFRTTKYERAWRDEIVME
ncbi:hypothetical protein [Luteolibacter soli]|uniref:DUF4113 domain-containing protein n=1 Tax=Luteolibacter soli TaxID=3135280 RepID=A0ABU9B018_9BACT